MKLIKKTGLVLTLLAVLALPVFGDDPTIDQFKGAITDVGELLGQALITNSALGLNWSDAYIGQLIGLPPHFGIGASVGFNAIPMSKFESIAEDLGVGDDFPGDMPVNFAPLPAAAAEIRLGGFFLPFDIGIKALPIPEQDLGGGAKFQYFMLGGDFRYALMKEQGWKPSISVGVGLTYTKVKMSYSVDEDITINLADMDTSGGYSGYTNETLTITPPTLAFEMRNTTLDLKVQVSKKLFIITPYLGLGLSYGWSTVDLGIGDTNISISGGPFNWKEQISEYIGVDLDDTSLEKTIKYSGLGARVFGGLSFDIFVVRLNLLGLYDIANQSWGASFGFRVQI
jgi:hypothetical protein